MKWPRLARTRLFGLLHKRRLEAEMDEEIRFHLAMRTEDYIAAGLTLPEASARAQRQLGNILLVKDEWRDLRGGGRDRNFLPRSAIWRARAAQRARVDCDRDYGAGARYWREYRSFHGH